MRNLKRTLSLVLAALMLMGMMVVGAGAASKDFTDGDEIDNVEAVDVMVGLGVLEGGNNGDFQPNSILTREQAAKIICYMLLGEESAEKLTTNYSIFSDVPANRWSAPFISYCVNLGILAGDGAGHFFPEGKLTGVAFAKMLMVCLGYSAERENYVGNNWEINTSAAAIAAGVAPKGLVLSDELSRQDAAQMAFNTLTATMVEYLNDNTIIIGGQTIVSTTGKASPVAQGVYTDTMDIEYLQFAEKYFDKLILTRSMTDVFGRPAHIWTYRNDDIGTYTDNDMLVATYTDSVKGKEAYADIGYSVIKQYDLKVYVDGAQVDTITKADLTSSNSKTLTGTGKGVLTEVYVNHETEEISIVIINTYLAKVESDYNERNETLPVSVYVGVNGTTNVTSYKRLDLADFSNLADFGEGDMLKVTMAAPDHDADAGYNEYTVQSIDVPEVVSDATVTSYTTTRDNTLNNVYHLDTLTADGTKYSTSAKSYYDAEIMYNYNDSLDQLRDSTYNLYMDNYGNVLGVEPVTVADNYIFVVGYETGYSPVVTTVDQALVITPEGDMKVVDIRDDKAKVWDDANAEWDDMASLGDEEAVNTWFTYTMDGDTYILNKVVKNQGRSLMADGGKDVDISGTYATLPTNNHIDNEPTAAYGNASSVYIAVDADQTVGNKHGSIVKVNGVTTGIKNTNLIVTDVSGMSNFDNVYQPVDPDNMYYRNQAQNSDNFDTFFIYNSKGYVTYAVVVGEDATSSDNLMYFRSGATGRYYDSTLKGYYVTYDVILDGEMVEAKVLDAEATSVNPREGDLRVATIDQNGYVEELGNDLTDTNPMNTTTNKANDYAMQTGIINLRLEGATLWVDTETYEDNYVVIDDSCLVFVKGAGEDDFEEYANIDAALASLGSNDANSGDYISQVVAITDNANGYATALIIVESESVFYTAATAQAVSVRGGTAATANAWNNDGAVTYTWYTTSGAATTDRQALNANFTADGNTLTAKAGTPAGTYYFRVMAVDRRGNVDYSNVTVTVTDVVYAITAQGARMDAYNIAVNLTKNGAPVATGTTAKITVQSWAQYVGWVNYSEHTADAADDGYYLLTGAATGLPAGGTYRLMIEVDGDVLYSNSMTK